MFARFLDVSFPKITFKIYVQAEKLLFCFSQKKIVVQVKHAFCRFRYRRVQHPSKFTDEVVTFWEPLFFYSSLCTRRNFVPSARRCRQRRDADRGEAALRRRRWIRRKLGTGGGVCKVPPTSQSRQRLPGRLTPSALAITSYAASRPFFGDSVCQTLRSGFYCWFISVHLTPYPFPDTPSPPRSPFPSPTVLGVVCHLFAKSSKMDIFNNIKDRARTTFRGSVKTFNRP